MEISNELSLVEKKKLVLGHIDGVVKTFLDIKQTLVGILETNKYLDASDKMRERQKILKNTSEKLKDLMIDIEKVKAANSHRNNSEIQEAHEKISLNIHTTIQDIIHETKIKTIISVSGTLQELVTHLSKHMKTGIGLEYLVMSDPKKYKPIANPLHLEHMRVELGTQIKNIDHRITDISGIVKLIEYLDIEEKSPILNELLDYILGGKAYDEIKHIMEAQGIFIEEIDIKSNLPGDELMGGVKTQNNSLINQTQTTSAETPSSEARPQKTQDTQVEFIPITPQNEGFFDKIFKVIGISK